MKPGDASQGAHRFALVRYFAIASLVCTAVIGIALAWTYQYLATRNLTRLAEDRNEALTKAFSNALWTRFAPIVDASRSASAEELRALAVRNDLQTAASKQMRGTEVIKIKIYGLNGITAFSTDPRQIGENKKDNPGFRAAGSGTVTSDLTHRDTFDAFEGTLNNLDVLATYLPILDDHQQPTAVFEIYSDVTDLVQQTRQTRTMLLASVIGLFGLLYTLLYLLVFRAQNIIDAQGDALSDYLARLEDANHELDRRVQERTQSLSEINQQLRSEIEDRRAAESELKLAATVFETTIEGITITDADERIVAVNKAFTQVTGYTEAEVLGKTPRLLSSGRQDTAFYREMWASVRRQGYWKGEIWNRRKDGEIYPQLLSLSAVRGPTNIITNYVAVFSDISAIKETQARLEQLANRDPLTGLPNRAYFASRAGEAIRTIGNSNRRLAILFLDLDHFKHVNDTLGHEVGDLLLQQVARTLSVQLRDGDMLARLGGDEFTILLERDVSQRGVELIARKLVASLNRPFTVEPHELFVSVSIGVALYPDDGPDVATLVKHADTAMFEAKAHGRNAYHFYEPAMTAYAVDRLNTELMLRKCVSNGELRIYYQPQVDLLSGHLVGAEALVRWVHPVHGLLSPYKFISIAEESGQIAEIGTWVLRETCRQFADWRARGIKLPKVAVNVSAKQLARGDFPGLVAAILTEFSIPPHCLELELTESAIMGTDNAFEALDEIRKIGIELAIDDFGTGYSSLSHLKRLPISKLKIDRSFILDIANDPQDVAIVRSVIALARTMGLTTVAEGVEDQLQINFLVQEGCGQIQGFLVSHPVPPDEMATLLSEWFPNPAIHRAA